MTKNQLSEHLVHGSPYDFDAEGEEEDSNDDEQRYSKYKKVQKLEIQILHYKGSRRRKTFGWLNKDIKIVD